MKNLNNIKFFFLSKIITNSILCVLNLIFKFKTGSCDVALADLEIIKEFCAGFKLTVNLSPLPHMGWGYRFKPAQLVKPVNTEIIVEQHFELKVEFKDSRENKIRWEGTYGYIKTNKHMYHMKENFR